MPSKSLSKRRRNRGVILTSKGWHKFQQAKQAAEAEDNCGKSRTCGQRTDEDTHCG